LELCNEILSGNKNLANQVSYSSVMVKEESLSFYAFCIFY